MSKLLARFLVTTVFLATPHFADAGSPSKLDVLTLFFKGGPENMQAVREEVARLMEPAGFTVQWKHMTERRVGEDFAHLATVDFRGACAMNAAVPPPFGARPEVRSLAETAISDGQILPFSTVHCDALRQVMGPLLAATRRDERPAMFARAAARVLAHELFHMLAQTTVHADRGVSKSCFGVAELTAEAFWFDEATIAHMRPPEPVSSDEEFEFGR